MDGVTVIYFSAVIAFLTGWFLWTHLWGSPYQSLSRKRIIVTGASSGIGRQLALQLAEKGCQLVLVARNEEHLKEVAGECRNISPGATVVPIPCDLGDLKSIKYHFNRFLCVPHLLRGISDRAFHALGDIDGIVLNAGHAACCRVDEMSNNLEFVSRIMDVNYLSCVHLVVHTLPHLKRNKGFILATSTVQGFLETLRLEMRKHGVTITIAYPSFVDTQLLQRTIGPKSLRTYNPDKSKAISPQAIVAVQIKLTLKVVAKKMIEGVEHKQNRVMFGTLDKLAVYLRPFLPSLIDLIVEKEVEHALS